MRWIVVFHCSPVREAEMSLEPDGRTLLVTNYSSRQLEAIDLTTLP